MFFGTSAALEAQFKFGGSHGLSLQIARRFELAGRREAAHADIEEGF